MVQIVDTEKELKKTLRRYYFGRIGLAIAKKDGFEDIELSFKERKDILSETFANFRISFEDNIDFYRMTFFNTFEKEYRELCKKMEMEKIRE